ncbi:MAG: ATP-dependent DNA helicase RecG [Spirochaetales bacterium]|nr:ATP-dependent DNA helicase RecG [Spirochaetales bacterium]
MYQGELRQPITRLNGIGPKTSAVLSAAGILTINDILKHYPRTYENRLRQVPLSAAAERTEAVIINTQAVVLSHELFGWGPKQTLKVIVRDEAGLTASLVCFGRNFLAEKLKIDSRILLYGSFQSRYNEIQSSSFEFEPIPDIVKEAFPAPEAVSGFSKNFGRILPVYALVSGLNQNILRKACTHAIQEWAQNIENEIPETLRTENGLLSKPDAVREIHFPESEEMIEKALLSLKFEELFHFQFSALRRAYSRKNAASRLKASPSDHPQAGILEAKLLPKIGFQLTAAQQKVLGEIKYDILAEKPMSRLLQGDVGSGKTLVAFIAALSAIEEGGQAAFMAPTELLARQHAENAHKLLSPLGIKIALLTGSVKIDKRQLLLRALAAGDIDLIIGTHSLFSETVVFRNLSLIIVDEQQKFGVLQRLALSGKNSSADILLMTATPIPRTLALTVFGDMEVSVIDELPPGRIPVETHLAAIGNEKKVYEFIRRELQKGRQAYFIYPLISRSDKSSLKDAESMFKQLKDGIFSDYRVSLIHSRLDENLKKQIMDDFRDGKIDILAATSVVEVGVDVPNASCMVIEHAERFGLSALHQLRGRVGRGTHSSYAFLIYSPELTEAGTARLRIMKESTDGFLIAEQDLKIRGPGNMSGLEQSGFIPFTIADLNTDFDILKDARRAAEGLVADDPGLLKAENSCLRRLLEACPPFSDDIFGG